MKVTYAMLSSVLVLAALAFVAQSQTLTFPYCRCNDNNFDTPFFIQSFQLVNSTETTNDYSLTIGQAGTVGISPCSEMDVNKVEFHINDKCRYSVGNIWITTNYGLDGTEVEGRSASFQDYGPEQLVFKVTRLGWTKDTAYGSKIYIQLKKDSECPTKETFFVDDNVYAIANKDKTCCPVFDFTALVNPTGTIYGNV